MPNESPTTIIELGAGEIDVDVPGLFLRARLVQAAARQERRRDRIVAGAAERRGERRLCQHRCRRPLPRRRRAAIEFLIKLLEHAGGVFAARHAQVQPLLGFGKQRVGVVFAVVAALAAVLLRHRRHQPTRQRLAVGELHAIGHRHRRIVPRGAIIGFRRCRGAAIRHKAGQQLGDFIGGKRRDALLQPEQPGEQAVEPGALLRGERRGFGNEGRDRRPRRHAHAAVSCSTSALSASTS